MELLNRVAVITGGSGGIGKAMAEAFLREGARGVVLADLDRDLVMKTAEELGCLGMACDVTAESDIQALVAYTNEQLGEIDLFCSNAGAGGGGLLTDAEN